MHHIYTTKAFIIHSTPHGEAGKFLLLFTKDFGMIGATAQGIRLGKSKLRSHLTDFSLSNVSLVKGKEVWRITGAQEIGQGKKNVIQIRILRLLKRLLHGEEKNERLFKIIENLYDTKIEDRSLEDIECLTILRILDTLGYVSNIDKYNVTLPLDKGIKSEIIKTINQSLKESHL